MDWVYKDIRLLTESERAAAAQDHQRWLAKGNALGFGEWYRERDQRRYEALLARIWETGQDGPCIVTGRLGFGGSRQRLIPQRYGRITDAVSDVMVSGCAHRNEIALHEGGIVVRQHRDDGVGMFAIRLLAPSGGRIRDTRALERKRFWKSLTGIGPEDVCI